VGAESVRSGGVASDGGASGPDVGSRVGADVGVVDCCGVVAADRSVGAGVPAGPSTVADGVGSAGRAVRPRTTRFRPVGSSNSSSRTGGATGGLVETRLGGGLVGTVPAGENALLRAGFACLRSPGSGGSPWVSSVEGVVLTARTLPKGAPLDALPP
jgi:hypothetical protein